MGKALPIPVLAPSTPTEPNQNPHHNKTILVRNGTLALQPQTRSGDKMFEAFLLSTVLWRLLAGKTEREAKMRYIKQEVEFARSEMNFSFVVEGKEGDAKEAGDDVVVDAVLGWAEAAVVSRVPAPASKHLLQAVKKLRTDPATDTQEQRPRQPTGQPPSPTTKAQEDIADVPRFLGPVEDSPIEDIDYKGIFDDAGMLDARTKPASVKPQPPRRLSRNPPKPAGDEHVVVGGKRSLEQLKEEFESLHPATIKRQRILPNDVVSGKGERAKIQNEGFRALIRANAPAFRNMDTGDSDTDLTEKRKIAYRIALTVVERGGCFLGKQDEPMDPKRAFKRVMTSLKDWKQPGAKKASAKKAKTPPTKPTHPPKQTRQPTHETPKPTAPEDRNVEGVLVSPALLDAALFGQEEIFGSLFDEAAEEDLDGFFDGVVGL